MKSCPGWLPFVAALLSACLQPSDGLLPPEEPRLVDNAEVDTLVVDSLPEPEAPKTWRIGTLNVYRFFDTTCDSGTCGADAFEPLVSDDQFEGKARAISRAIQAMDCDFVLLQEVESELCLNALQARLGDRYSIAYIGEVGTPASSDVALLAKGELIDVKRHRDTPIPRADGTFTSFTRELPEVHISHEEQHFILLPLHFRSKYNDNPDKRLAEAEAAQRIVSDLALAHPAAIVILGGDVNDDIGSPAMLALEADGLLDSVHDDVPQHKRWTYEYRNSESMIDHLFLARDARGHWVLGETRVVREDIIGSWPSDHAALTATIAQE